MCVLKSRKKKKSEGLSGIEFFLSDSSSALYSCFHCVTLCRNRKVRTRLRPTEPAATGVQHRRHRIRHRFSRPNTARRLQRRLAQHRTRLHHHRRTPRATRRTQHTNIRRLSSHSRSTRLRFLRTVAAPLLTARLRLLRRRCTRHPLRQPPVPTLRTRPIQSMVATQPRSSSKSSKSSSYLLRQHRRQPRHRCRRTPTFHTV